LRPLAGFGVSPISMMKPILDVLFPSRCAGCGARGPNLCDRCLAGTRPVDAASCPRCGRPSRLGARCPACRGYDGPLAGIRAARVYEGALRSAVHAFKYRHRRALAGPLARLVIDELRARPLLLDLLVPVPLHPARERERGYNQSELLARELAEALAVPVAGCLERTRETGVQAELGRAERRANVRGAFRCAGAATVAGKRVGIVDDVCTTGATLEECARALREAESSIVWGIVVARDL
jgi:competence protein ComFC